MHFAESDGRYGCDYHIHIGKYLSSLCKLDHVIVLKAGGETQLRTPRLAIPFGMSALGMTRQRGDGRLQGGIEPHHVSTLPGLDKVAEDMQGTHRHLACRHGHLREELGHVRQKP